MSDAVRDVTLSDKPARRNARQSASEIIIENLRHRILSGSFPEGSALPRAIDLRGEFGVGAPTLRAAMRVLEVEGLIQVVPGSRAGPVVRRPSEGVVARYAGYVLESQPAGPDDVPQTLNLIEASAIAMLVPSDPVVSGLRQRLVEIARQPDDREGGRANLLRQEFRLALAEASGNKTLAFLSRLLHALAPKCSAQEHDVHDPQAWLDHYLKALDYLERGDTSAAAAHCAARFSFRPGNSAAP